METIKTVQSIPATQDLPPRLLRMAEVKDRCGISRAYVHRLVAAGLFPKPIKISDKGRASGWLESEITAWINKRIADSRDQDAA